MPQKIKCVTFQEIKKGKLFKYEKRIWKKTSNNEADLRDGGFAIFNQGCEVEIFKGKIW